MSGLEAFTQPWADRYRDALNANEAYAEAGETWEGPIALHLRPNPAEGVDEDRVVLLDLWHGECRSAAMIALDEAMEQADIVISGGWGTWMDVLDGELGPLKALMFGKLKLRKGKMRRLVPYTRASKEMVASAQEVPIDR